MNKTTIDAQAARVDELQKPVGSVSVLASEEGEALTEAEKAVQQWRERGPEEPGVLAWALSRGGGHYTVDTTLAECEVIPTLLHPSVVSVAGELGYRVVRVRIVEVE